MSHVGTHRTEEDIERYSVYSAAALTFSRVFRMRLGAGDVNTSVRIHTHTPARY
jgi:hypothetical protein